MTCRNPEEAELAAALYVLDELRKYYNGPICVETDCSTIPALLKERSENKSKLYISPSHGCQTPHGCFQRGFHQISKKIQQQDGPRAGRPSKKARKLYYCR